MLAAAALAIGFAAAPAPIAMAQINPVDADGNIGMQSPPNSVSLDRPGARPSEPGVGQNPGPEEQMQQSSGGFEGLGQQQMANSAARRVVQTYNAGVAGLGALGVGRPVIVLDDRETSALIGNGWGAADGSAGSDGPAGNADLRERVDLLVAIAIRLGHGAHVGALQASYGTPQENGLFELQSRIADLEARSALSADQRAELAALRAEFEDRREAVKPGPGPTDGWELVNLDANGDGRVDRADLN